MLNKTTSLKKVRHHLSKKTLPLLGLIFLFSSNAWSSCEFTSALTGLRWTPNVGNIAVQRDAPVGTVIYRQSLSSSYIGRQILSCTTTSESQTFTMASGSPVPGLTNVYTTNIPGVGVKVTSAAGRAFTSPGTTWQFSAPFTLVDAPFAFELIKTGDISGGALTTAPLFNWTTPKTSGGTLIVARLTLSGGTVNTVACSISNTAINVPMGDVGRSTFTGVGTTGTPVQFFISLNCDAGTRINFKIDATADSSGAPGVMAINTSAPGNAASGVGIKLTRSSVPVSFGTTILAGVSPNNGMYYIPIIAQYYQTLPNITAGQANGTATFTMTYN
jgi:type 1 fimbria pilin